MHFPNMVKMNMRKLGPIESKKFNNDICGATADVERLHRKFDEIKARIRTLGAPTQEIMIDIDHGRKRMVRL